MLEFLFEILGELFLQLFLELFAEFGARAVASKFDKPPNPWLAAIGYAIFGAVLGGVSLLLLPHNLIKDQALRILNLVVTPIVVGLLMGAFGAWRARRGQVVLRIDRFAYGYLFALALALVRYGFAK